MTWKTSDLPRLEAITAVVTGANSGIGFHAAKELASHGARVVLACRSVSAGHEAAARMAKNVDVVELDLASLDSVRAFAQQWDGSLDLLVNNAGVMAPPRWRGTADGFELQYGTNHLGHVALTAGLLPALLRSEAPRVVTVSSLAHHAGDWTLLDGNPAESYDARRAYGNSKLGNLLFAAELQARATAAGSPLVSVACHPGIASTGLFVSRDGMGANRLIRTAGTVFMPVLTQSSRSGAMPTLYAATAADPGSYSGPQWLGETRGPVGPAKLSPWARDADLRKQAWDVALAETRATIEF